MTTPRSRQERRKERYQTLRDLGYSAKEARKLRDFSGPKINQDVRLTQRRLSRIPKARRKPEQEDRLRRIRDFRSRETERPSVNGGDIIFDTREQRLNRFRQWSKTKRFPRHIVDEITEINLNAGLDPLDSFGYRVFYHKYVNRVPDVEAFRRGETRDT